MRLTPGWPFSARRAVLRRARFGQAVRDLRQGPELLAGGGILAGLGFAESDYVRPTRELSGGSWPLRHFPLSQPPASGLHQLWRLVAQAAGFLEALVLDRVLLLLLHLGDA